MSESITPRQNISPKLLQYLSQIQQNLATSLEQGSFQLGEHEDNICNPQALQEKVYQKRLAQIKEMKQSLIQKVQKLSEEEEILRRSNLKKSVKKYQRSFFTEADKEKIVKTKKKNQQEIRKRDLKIIQILKKISEKQYQIQEQHRIHLEQQKRARVAKIMEKRNNTDQKRKLNKSPTMKINKKNYQYVKNLEKDKQIEEERKKYDQLILRQKKQRMKIDFELIKNSSIQHNQSIQRRKKQYEKQLKQEMKERLKKVKSELPFAETQALRRVKRQLTESKVERQSNFNKIKQMREKMIEYQNHIKLNFKPTISNNSKFMLEKPMIQIFNSDPKQRFEKGNQYLSIAKKMRKMKTAQEESSMFYNDTSLTTNTKIKYANYLNDVKVHKNSTQGSVNKILDDSDENPLVKAEKALKIVRNREERKKYLSKKQINRTNFQSVKDKISILQSLMTIEH